MICHECKQDKPKHQMYGDGGKLCEATMITRDSARTREHELCYECWRAYSDRTFHNITREGDTFYLTTAF